MGRDDVPKNIGNLPPPPCFSDAECCLHCLHSERREGSSNFLNCKKYKSICEDTTTCKDYAREGASSLADPLPLAISMLEECDRWACEALSKYIHKIGMFETELSVNDVYVHQQKIRIVLKKLRGFSVFP